MDKAVAAKITRDASGVRPGQASVHIAIACRPLAHTEFETENRVL